MVRYCCQNKFIDYKWRSGLLAWDIFANLFLNALTHFFPPESHLVKFLIGPTNQSLLIWVWAESDVFPYFCQLSLIKILLCPSAPLGRKFSCLRQTGLSSQATWTLSNSWEWGTPFDWVDLDSSIMPLLKICQDLKWEKKNLSSKKLSLLIQLNNGYFVDCDVSVQLLQSNFALFFFFLVQGKLCKETGTKYPTDVYQKAEDIGIYIKVWSVFTKYWE